MTTIALSEARRAAITTWLLANNIDPATVPINSTIIENQQIGTIRYTAYANPTYPNNDPTTGENTISVSHDDMVEWREVPLLVPAPDFPA